MLALICSAGVSAQSVFNEIYDGELKMYGPDNIGAAMICLSHAYKTRICVEIDSLCGIELVTFTNASMGQVFSDIISANTNYMWRYENYNDTIYVHPKTNAISMMRCGAISLTNTLVKTIFKETDKLGLNEHKITLGGDRKRGFLIEPWTWTDESVSLEFEEGTYFWQVLDAIDAQLPNGRYWSIQKSSFEANYHLHFSHSNSD